MSVKRYEPQTIGAPNPATMVIDSNGHYIRFTDHLADIARLTKERDALREVLENVYHQLKGRGYLNFEDVMEIQQALAAKQEGEDDE